MLKDNLISSVGQSFNMKNYRTSEHFALSHESGKCDSFLITLDILWTLWVLPFHFGRFPICVGSTLAYAVDNVDFFLFSTHQYYAVLIEKTFPFTVNHKQKK